MVQPTRRDIVIGGAAATLAAGAADADTAPRESGTAAVAPLATGTVTEVVAAGGAVLVKGPPVSGVIVSNGRDVVRTAVDGRFSLPVAAGQTIFMVKPSGFRVPIDSATHLPFFSYVHDPLGTPPSLGFRYGGMPPTGPLPASIDFQLTRVPESDRFDVLLFTDPQPESTVELEFVRDDVVSSLIGADVAFGMTCGDLMFDDLSLYPRYNRIIGRIGPTWWNIGGNHDLDYEAPDAKRSRDTFKRHFGATYYAHEYGNALFVMLDNVEYLGAGSGKPGQHGAYRGVFPSDQLAFVKALLDLTPAERLIVFVMHIPLTTYLDPKDPARNTVNAADLLALVGDRPCVSFAGHTHTTEHHYLDAAAGFSGKVPHHHHVLTAVSGSWWSGPLDHRGIACADSYDGTPNGHHMLSVEGSGYTTRFVPAAEPAGVRMRISLDSQFHAGDREVQRELPMAALLRSPLSVDQAEATQVIVNVFDGGPKTTVAYSFDGGAPVAMTKVSRPDPFVVQVYDRHPDTIKSWVTPQASSHLWMAPLPRGMRPGAFALQVRVIDEYGRRHTDGLVLEIV